MDKISHFIEIIDILPLTLYVALYYISVKKKCLPFVLISMMGLTALSLSIYDATGDLITLAIIWAAAFIFCRLFKIDTLIV